MKILIKRRPSAHGCTLSEWYVNDKFECFGVEDITRPAGQKVHGATAIPAGTYTVVNTYSPTFKQYLPLLLNVPGFAGVRIHSGNTAADTEGCLLPGTTILPGEKGVGNSRLAFRTLFAKIKAVEKQEKITLAIQ